MTLTLPIKLHGWIQMLVGYNQPVLTADAQKDSYGQNADWQSFRNCTDYISKALKHLADKDIIASCRIHREFGKLKRPNSGHKNDDSNIYLSYLWEGAEKIIELARHISANPNYTVDFDMKSEIMVMSESIAELAGSCNGKQIDVMRDKIQKEYDFIQHNIKERSKNMKHEHFNDGALEYSYLVLLYHLHAFLNAASKLSIFR